MEISSRCWCSRTVVGIPVSWVRQGRTVACGVEGCGPGCRMVEDGQIDRYDEPEYARPARRTRMNKFNPSKYDPRADSSPGLSNPTGSLMLMVGDGLCACGCEQIPKGKKALFCMGHDIRLRGKLARSRSAGREVVLQSRLGVQTAMDPLEYAARFTTDSLDWPAAIESSAANTLKAKPTASRAEQEVYTRATGPQEGDRRLIQVGRWEFTGKVAAIYDDGGRIVYEYVDKQGEIRRAEQGADGKVHSVAESA